MGSYMKVLSASPSAAGVRRAISLVGAAAAAVKKQPNPTANVAADILPYAAGAAAGVLLWKKHRVLGFFGGGALVSSVARLIKGESKSDVLWGLGLTGTAIAGSLAWKRHPVLGFIGAEVIAQAVSSLVPDSPAYNARQRLAA